MPRRNDSDLGELLLVVADSAEENGVDWLASLMRGMAETWHDRHKKKVSREKLNDSLVEAAGEVLHEEERKKYFKIVREAAHASMVEADFDYEGAVLDEAVEDASLRLGLASVGIDEAISSYLHALAATGLWRDHDDRRPRVQFDFMNRPQHADEVLFRLAAVAVNHDVNMQAIEIAGEAVVPGPRGPRR